MLSTPLFWQIAIPVGLIVLGYLVGSSLERGHYRSILAREEALRSLPIISIRRVPEDLPALGPAPKTLLVRGSVVISVDYFKRFLAGLRMMFGGRVTTYESLVDRARREALLRMRQQARNFGACMIVNVRMETASISKGGRGAIGSVEVLAYGTAAIPGGDATLKYENPKIPEGINVSPRNPLRELAVLTAGAAALIAALMAAMIWLGGYAAQLAPFAERALVEATFEPPPPEDAETATLQGLADRLVQHMSLPDDMTVTVHFVDDPMVNALATLGGHILVFRGLTDRLSSENALAMVLAHEIAHILHRDPARALGGGILANLVLQMVLGNTNGWGDGILVGSGVLVQLRFSRDVERRADRDGLAAVAALYGHVGGSTELYEALLGAAGVGEEATPAFLSTHPLTRERIADIAAQAEAEGWPPAGSLTPMPAVLARP